MDSQTWLWLDTILMTVGGLAILAIGKQRTSGEQAHTIYHGIVPILAACSYFAMAVGQGAVSIHQGPADAGTTRLFYFARYIDWTFTTPLLLLSLAHTAMHSGMRRGGMVAGLLISDVLMIVTAFLFGASTVEWVKWTWFLVSCVAFLGVFYVMWVPMLRENAMESAEARSDYRRNAAMLSVLWLVYPLILAVSTDGLGTINSTQSVAAVAIIDVISKVAYGLLTVISTTRLVTSDLAGETKPTLRRVAV